MLADLHLVALAGAGQRADEKRRLARLERSVGVEAGFTSKDGINWMKQL